MKRHQPRPDSKAVQQALDLIPNAEQTPYCPTNNARPGAPCMPSGELCTICPANWRRYPV